MTGASLSSENMDVLGESQSLTNLNFNDSIYTLEEGIDGDDDRDDDQEFTLSLTEQQGLVTIFVQTSCETNEDRQQMMT